jgi:hypothetical protein
MWVPQFRIKALMILVAVAALGFAAAADIRVGLGLAGLVVAMAFLLPLVAGLVAISQEFRDRSRDEGGPSCPPHNARSRPD